MKADILCKLNMTWPSLSLCLFSPFISCNWTCILGFGCSAVSYKTFTNPHPRYLDDVLIFHKMAARYLLVRLPVFFWYNQSRAGKLDCFWNYGKHKAHQKKVTQKNLQTRRTKCQKCQRYRISVGFYVDAMTQGTLILGLYCSYADCTIEHVVVELV